MYIALINHPDIKKYDLSSIEACISGSAPLPAEVQQTFERLTGGKLVEGYGLSESSPVTHCNLIWGDKISGSIGIPFPDTDAKIVSVETGEECSVNEIGELVVKGPQVMKGYWQRPDATAEVLDADGWFKSGDIAIIQADGYIKIVDRKKDMINVSGFKVFPNEVEDVLAGHPDIVEAAVIGVPDNDGSETVKAFVVTNNPSLTIADVRDYAKTKLTPYKVPHLVEFRNELPKTNVGKVLRRELKDQESKAAQ